MVRTKREDWRVNTIRVKAGLEMGEEGEWSALALLPLAYCLKKVSGRSSDRHIQSDSLHD